MEFIDIGARLRVVDDYWRRTIPLFADPDDPAIRRLGRTYGEVMRERARREEEERKRRESED